MDFDYSTGQPLGYDSNVSEAVLMEKFMELLLSPP